MSMTKLRAAILLSALLFLSAACQTTTVTTAGPPPIPAKPAGPVPTAALMPWYSSDLLAADHAYKQLTACLQERYAFDFVSQGDALQAVEKTGVDVEQVFGPDDEDYAKVADALGVDYVMWGAITIMKDLTFAGWRKDVTSIIELHRADGAKVDEWRSNTAGTFTDADTATDTAKMVDSAMNHMCARILRGKKK